MYQLYVYGPGRFHHVGSECGFLDYNFKFMDLIFLHSLEEDMI